jgi:uncharacterized protein YecE (DUF72 family)
VDLNASFYRWPRDASDAGWRRRLPDGLQLSVKAPRGLTHAKRLYSPESWVPRLTSAWHELGDRRAVLLVQLHPAHERDDARLEWFLARLPSWMRVAVEFRHPSWHDDGANLPCVLRARAPFVYVRRHGPDPGFLYAGSYSDDDLRWWADRVGEWAASGRDVFVYFNNDGDGHAVRNATRLREFVGA